MRATIPLVFLSLLLLASWVQADEVPVTGVKLFARQGRWFQLIEHSMPTSSAKSPVQVLLPRGQASIPQELVVEPMGQWATRLELPAGAVSELSAATVEALRGNLVRVTVKDRSAEGQLVAVTNDTVMLEEKVPEGFRYHPFLRKELLSLLVLDQRVNARASGRLVFSPVPDTTPAEICVRYLLEVPAPEFTYELVAPADAAGVTQLVGNVALTNASGQEWPNLLSVKLEPPSHNEVTLSSPLLAVGNTYRLPFYRCDKLSPLWLWPFRATELAPHPEFVVEATDELKQLPRGACTVQFADYELVRTTVPHSSEYFLRVALPGPAAFRQETLSADSRTMGIAQQGVWLWSYDWVDLSYRVTSKDGSYPIRFLAPDESRIDGRAGTHYELSVSSPYTDASNIRLAADRPLIVSLAAVPVKLAPPRDLRELEPGEVSRVLPSWIDGDVSDQQFREVSGLLEELEAAEQERAAVGRRNPSDGAPTSLSPAPVGVSLLANEIAAEGREVARRASELDSRIQEILHELQFIATRRPVEVNFEPSLPHIRP